MISQVHRSAAAGSRSFGAVQPMTCLNILKVCSRSKRRRNACHIRSTSAGGAQVSEHHSHTGLGARSPGRWSTWRRISVPSMTGSGPSWSSQAERWVSRGCSRSQARATAVPYRVVAVVVITAGSGQVTGSARANSRPWRGRRPLVPDWRPGRGNAAPGRSAAGPAPRRAGQRAGEPAASGHRRHRRSPGPAGPLAPVPGGDQPGDHLTD